MAASVGLPTQPSLTISLPKIAVATRVTMSRALRVSVYNIVPAGGQIPVLKLIWEVDIGAAGGGASSGVVCLAWAGESVILGVGLKYFITWPQRSGISSSNSKEGDSKMVGAWRDLLSIEEDTALSRNNNSSTEEEDSLKAATVSAISLPLRGCAFISVGLLGLVVQPSGEPRGNPILFQNIPAVRALACGAGVIAVVCEDGIRIADPATGHWIQGLGYGDNMMPAPGQPLRASGGGRSDSSGIVVAGRHKVWVLTPIPIVEQVRDMLSRRDFAGALQLAAKVRAEGKIWSEEAYAQTAILLMHEGRFLEALVALEPCSPSAFQPAELFPLFPQYTKQWEPHPAPLHWSLSGPLEALEKMIRKSPLLRRRHQTTDGNAADTGSNGSSRGELIGEERLREAKQAIVQYLFRARVLPEVSTLDGVDTLLMHLLIDLEAAQEAAAFAAVVPHAIVPELVAERLEKVGWRHALAILWAATGNAEPALKIWKELIDSSSASTIDSSSTGTISRTARSTETELSLRERQEAIHGVSSLLQSQETCPDIHLVLLYIPWLLKVSSADASHVLSSRQDLKFQNILPSLPMGEETRWRYLEHLISLESPSIAAVDDDDDDINRSELKFLHTELAEALIAAIFKISPELKEEEEEPIERSSGSGSYDGDQQQRNRVARHRSVLPMVLPQAATHTIDNNGTSTMTTSPPLSVAALVSGMRPPNPEDAVDATESLRFRLRSHLEISLNIDYTQILSSLQGTSLLEEIAVVHWRQGDHKAVLRVLAVALNDVNAAVCYASVYLPPEDHRMLLNLLLNPEESGNKLSTEVQQPRWEDACRVVALLGNTLDSLEVVRAAPEGMPMPAAVKLMAPLLRERVHRRRNGQLTAALHRSQAASGAVTLAAVQEQQVVVDEGRACPDCHLRLGGKVFVVVQQQQQQQQQQQETAPPPPPNVFCLSCWNKRHSK